jgi:hypothetical protein
MSKFLIGALLGIGLAVGAGFGYQQWHEKNDPCISRCGDGTICDRGHCIPMPAPVAAAPPPKSKKGRKRAPTDGAPQVQLQPGDTKIVSEGDDIKRPSTKLDLVADDGAPSDLDQDQLDAIFSPHRDEISNCVVDSVGDAPLEAGAKATVSFRVEPDGSVKRVRLTAPQLMMRNHLMSCVRGIVTALRFPHASGATLATYPFELK